PTQPLKCHLAYDIRRPGSRDSGAENRLYQDSETCSRNKEDRTMRQSNFEQARTYALQRLQRELPAALTYHSLAHTRDDVAPATLRLAAVAGVSGEQRMLLHTAAYYHDIGFVLQRIDHEAIGAQIAAEVLPDFGYSPEQIDLIHG